MTTNVHFNDWAYLDGGRTHPYTGKFLSRLALNVPRCYDLMHLDLVYTL